MKPSEAARAARDLVASIGRLASPEVGQPRRHPSSPAPPLLPRLDSLEQTALHELGHALAGLWLDVRIVEVCLGRAGTATGFCDYVGKISDPLVSAAYSVAGYVAETIFYGDWRARPIIETEEVPDDEDDHEIALAAAGSLEVLEQIEALVERSLRDERAVDALDRLAPCLVSERRILRRRIDDAIDAAGARPVGGILRTGLEAIRRGSGDG